MKRPSEWVSIALIIMYDDTPVVTASPSMITVYVTEIQ